MFSRVFEGLANRGNHKAWRQWLKARGHYAAENAMDELVGRGCEPGPLTHLVIEVHRAVYLTSITKKDLASCTAALRRARAAVHTLAQSSLAYHLDLRPREAFDLITRLNDVVQRAQLEGARDATGKENVAYHWATADLISYVHTRTRAWHDKAISQILSALTGDDVDAKQWRRRHKDDLARARQRSRARASERRSREESELRVGLDIQD